MSEGWEAQQVQQSGAGRGAGSSSGAVSHALEAEAVLVPLHRLLQRHHGVVKLVDVLVLAPDLELHVPAGRGHEVVLDVPEVPGH